MAVAQETPALASQSIIIPSQPARAPARARAWLRVETIGLVGVLALSGLLNLVALDREGFGNTYYAAAVWSMLQSWRAFLFASFDAPGFVTVDKPPVGLWVQALSAKLLGFDGVALLLPQALAGVACVGLLYFLVRRAHGPVAGRTAALVLAVTPISVAVDRNNTMDATLILALLLAAWTVSLAAERGRLRWLLAAAALVGIGFNVKMLQAYPVVPGFALAYGLFAPLKRRVRLVHLVLAGILLLAVSLSWSVFVDLTPASARPYVGSSGSNSAVSLALGYNGLSRITLAIAQRVPALSFLGEAIDLDVAPGQAPGIGQPGLLRLLQPLLAGQVGWLLPLALVGLGGAAWLMLRQSEPAAGAEADLRRRRVSLAIWGGWLLVWGAIFSFARFFHVYYLAMLGPGVAAMAGIGLVALWRLYRESRAPFTRALLPLALGLSAVVEWQVVSAAPEVRGWLEVVVLATGALVAAGLLAVSLGGPALVGFVRPAIGIGLAGLLVAPLTWSAITVQTGEGGAWLPQAGPAVVSFGFGGRGAGGLPGGFGGSAPGAKLGAAGGRAGFGGRGAPNGTGSASTAPFPGGNPGGFGFGGGGPGAMTFAGAGWDQLPVGLVTYLEAHQGSSPYLVATGTSSYASLFILASSQPAMALGGYQGWDRILTPGELAQMVQDGTVRYFYVSPGSGGRGSSLDATADLVSWVGANCSVVPSSTWSGAGSANARRGSGGLQLYDCAPASPTS